MFKEGTLTLPIPQTSRKRGDRSLPFPQGSLFLPQLPTKEIAPLVVGAK